MINVDWFQPYKHIISYSVGVILLTIMNLPRALRYKEENIILAGIIPGPHEPHLNINSYINPLVEELLELWSGIEMDTTAGRKLVRCAVICASCDIPAGRKLCSFLGHTPRYSCTKCKKGFPCSVGKMDYSGYDRRNWKYRIDESHRQDVSNLLNCKSRNELKNLESSLGCRYSNLLRLPYFDAPRMLFIDPMHNLFCGTAKYYVHNCWLSNSLISKSQLEFIQDRINRTVVPPDIGRIPSKFQSGFASFTADQLKNWTVYYSAMVLHDIFASVRYGMLEALYTGMPTSLFQADYY